MPYLTSIGARGWGRGDQAAAWPGDFAITPECAAACDEGRSFLGSLRRSATVSSFPISAALLATACYGGPPRDPVTSLECHDDSDCEPGFQCATETHESCFFAPPCTTAAQNVCRRPPPTMGDPCLTQAWGACSSGLACAREQVDCTTPHTEAPPHPGWEPVGGGTACAPGGDQCVTFQCWGSPRICQPAGSHQNGEPCESLFSYERACASGLVCSWGFPDRACTEPGVAGSPCMSLSDCAGGLDCLRPPPMSSDCWNYTPCTDGSAAGCIQVTQCGTCR